MSWPTPSCEAIGCLAGNHRGSPGAGLTHGPRAWKCMFETLGGSTDSGEPARSLVVGYCGVLMRMGSCGLGVILVVGISVYPSATLLSASCIGGLSNDRHYSTSAAVFSGRASSQSVVKRDDGATELETAFEIEKQWKGEKATVIGVRTCESKGSFCSDPIRFDLGERYVVFAWGAPLRTTACSLTTRVEQADAILKWLDSRF